MLEIYLIKTFKNVHLHSFIWVHFILSMTWKWFVLFYTSRKTRTGLEKIFLIKNKGKKNISWILWMKGFNFSIWNFHKFKYFSVTSSFCAVNFFFFCDLKHLSSSILQFIYEYWNSIKTLDYCALVSVLEGLQVTVVDKGIWW